MRARRSLDTSPSVPFAAIGQNLPDGAASTLDCVEPELELVRSLLPPPPTVSFTKITSVDATKSRALRALRDNTWLHFSCHGTQKFYDPFKSAFLMRDLPLSLLDITQMEVNDSTVQRLVEAFYKNLCGDGKMISRRAAQALHQAVHSLARYKDMPLDQHIVFMHIGA
jgi:CHAT domain-containing protein